MYNELDQDTKATLKRLCVLKLIDTVLKTTMFVVIIALLYLMLSAVTAKLAEADVYRYTTADGVVSFTDDLKRVPSKYESKVTKLRVVDRDTKVIKLPSTLERLKRLRAKRLAIAPKLNVRYTGPFSFTTEQKPVRDYLGAPGVRYIWFYVLRDGNGEIIATSTELESLLQIVVGGSNEVAKH